MTEKDHFERSRKRARTHQAERMLRSLPVKESRGDSEGIDGDLSSVVDEPDTVCLLEGPNEFSGF
jgi:hypothetical protein